MILMREEGFRTPAPAAQESSFPSLRPEQVALAERLYKADSKFQMLADGLAEELLKESGLERLPKDQSLPSAALITIREKVNMAVQGGVSENHRLKQNGATQAELDRVIDIVLAHVMALHILEHRGK